MKRITITLAALGMAALNAFSNFTEAAEFNKDVKVREGIVSGKYDEKHQVVEWFGVPYAAEANGTNRYALPKKAVKFQEPKDCTKAAPVNLQFNGKKVLGKEGILTLDIVRPDTKEQNLPIMVYFHGGNNQASNSRLWIGEKFAQEANAVYVSVAYRLGGLGFNNLPAIVEKTGTGNLGFMDQAQALTWIKKNAKSFGGDAKNITVSGFSAGGRDVMAMLISPVFKNKFQKAISISGGLTVADNEASQKVVAAKFAPLVVADGKAANKEEAVKWLLSTNKKDTKDVREYLGNVEAERIAPLMAGAVIRMSSFPHLYGDKKTLPVEGFATKKFNSVPLVMLASSDEFSSFAARDDFFKKRLKEINVNPKTTEEFKYANKYGSLFYGYFNGHQSAEGIYDRYADKMYVCTFNFGHTPELVGEKFTARNGALHGVFMPFLSDQPYPFAKGAGFAAPGAKELSKALIASFAQFMRTGNPNAKELGVKWPAWNPKNERELVFDAHKNSANIYVRQNTVTYKGIMEALEADNSIDAASKDIIMHSVLSGRWFSDELDKKYGNKDLWAENASVSK